jgi:hypothetical protein
MVFSVLILYFDTLLYDFPLVASLSLPGLESPAEMHDAKLKVEIFCAGSPWIFPVESKADR